MFHILLKETGELDASINYLNRSIIIYGRN
jgi:hypothetical protein